MSVIDERIVKMVFDNAEFAGKIGQTITSLTQLNKATDQVANNSGGGLSAMGKAFEQAEITATKAGFHIQDVWLKVASILEYQVAGKIVKIGKDIANAMTFEGIADGFREYELKMGSVQTIMAGTGASLEQVNKYLEELNAYSDKTIYSFADMTNNIGKFTNAGVELDDAVLAIKGIANEAARSGANANEASRAMYNFSQALSAGYVKLIDWKSIENANMATKEFKDTLLEVASAAGTVEKQGDGMYKVLGKNASGATMKEAMSATKNFNDSLAYQWMTTDVLTKTMKIYATDVRDLSAAEKEAWESELKSMGFNDDQIKKFEELGSAATDAASEVKTFTMLIDTLKEAIGSGWAQTWEIIVGDFEEAKALWTEVSNVLGGVIDRSAKSRNELLKGWDALGGRKDVIDALRNSFEFLAGILKPIGEAMREVFPPTTRAQLYKLTHGLKEFTEGLKATTAITTRVKSIAKGFFSIFDIGLKLVKAFVNAILPAGKGLGDFAWNLFDAAAKLGNFISSLDETITKSKIFENVFQGIAKVIKPVFDFILSGGKGALALLGDFFGSFTDSAGKMGSASEILKRVFDDISGGIDNIKKKVEGLRPVFEGLSSIFKAIGKILGTAFKSIGDSISGISVGNNGLNGILTIFNGLLTGGVLYKLFSGVKSFSSIGESVSSVLDSLSGAINAFQKKVEAENLMNLAKAIAILAGSLVVVAMVDQNKLLGATTAITTMMFGMSGAMAVLMKAINSFSTTQVENTFSIFGKKLFGMNIGKTLEMAVTLQAVSKALIAMGAAVLMMSVGLKVVSSAAEGGHLWDSFAVVTLMLGELTLAAIALGKWGNEGKKGAKGLITMTAALILMAEALKMVSQVVEGGNAWQSLAIIGLMVAGLTGVMIAIDKLTKYKSISMAPLISMAISINLLVFALKSISDALGQEGQHIWQALGIVGLMAAGLAGVCVVLSKFAGFSALGAAGAILAATSILILVQALKQISDALGQTDQHIWQALGVIAASLVVLAVGLTAMSATIPGAAGLLVASAALIVLGGALKIIGSLSLAEIGKGLLAMAGSLIILAAGLTAMVLALPGAIALTVAAAGLTVLAGALKIFGSMSLGEIVKSLGMLVVALTGITVIVSALSIASPFVLAFSAALLVFGTALLATGAGLTIFSSGLQLLSAVIPTGVVALDILARSLIGLIPVAIAGIMDGLGVLCQKIVEYGPVIGEAVMTIIQIILKVLVESALQIGQAVLQIIIGILTVLTQNIPKIAKAGTDMMIAYMQAIAREIPRIVDQAYKCAIALINGLATAIETNNGELIAAVDHLMSAVIQAISQWLVKFTPLGLLIPENVKSGVMNGKLRVKDAIDNVIKNALDTIKGFVDKFKQAAENLVGGLIEGLKGSAVGKAVSAAAELGNKVIGGLNSKKGLDEHSPSERAKKSGEYVVDGLVDGMESKSGEAFDASASLGDGVIGALKDVTGDGITDISKQFDGMIPDGAPKNADKYTDKVKTARGETDDYSESLKHNKEAQEKQSKQIKETAKAYDDLGTASARSEKAMQKHTDSTVINVKAMTNAHDKAAALHEVQQQATYDKFDTTKATKENTKATEENTKAQTENAEATGKSGKAAKSSADVMEYASGVVEAFAQKYGHLYTELGEDAPMKVAQLAVRNLAEETYKASLAAEQATDKNKETKVSIEDMIKAFTDMRQKIYDSVKSEFEGESFFMDKFEAKTEMTMANVLENMKSHIDGVTSWAAKMQELGEKGVNQGLLKYLMELGPKGYELVNAFSNATTEEIAQANVMFEQAAALPDQISNNTLASYAKAGLNCVQGFANGIDKNAAMAKLSGDNLAVTTLNAIKTKAGIGSPSKVTYDYGMWLDTGLKNGIASYAYVAVNAAATMCNDIKTRVSNLLSKEKFYGYGQAIAIGISNGIYQNISSPVTSASALCSAIINEVSSKLSKDTFIEYGENVAYGLAEGMGSDSAKDAVRRAAKRLSEIASEITVNYNEISSPSRLYKKYGGYIAQGLAIGMTDGESYVENSATMLSKAIENTLSTLNAITEDDMELHPVISPVLDLSAVRASANTIGTLFPGRSLSMSSSIGIGRTPVDSTISSEAVPAGTQQINFTQNNYSPKALNRYEIYRQTNNQIRQLKGALS